MLFSEVVAASEAVAASSSRLTKIGILAGLFRKLAPGEIVPVIALVSGAPRQGRIGLGYATISSALSVAAAATPVLTVTEVDDSLTALGNVSGAGSARERVRLLSLLLSRATKSEQDFLQRALYGELRQGALEGVVLEAIARSAAVSSAKLRRAVLMSGSLPEAARAALTGGERALDGITVRVMQPVRPMLADSANDVEQALAEMPEASLEYKLDGARVQIHKAGDIVRVFSRALNDVTESAPEIVEMARGLSARDIILDGEVIALREDLRPHQFQTTMRRFGRRRGVQEMQPDLPLTLFAFDALYLDGTSLLDEPLEKRIEVLSQSAPAVAVPRVIRPTADEAKAFAASALDRGHEGVMAKALDAPYAAGRRGSAWLKIKQARTLDLVVLAAEWGHGRRRGWLSNLHLGARDPATGGFVMLGKTFKGMTDEMLGWQTERLLALEVARDGIVVHVRPELVVEVAFNEIQDSRQYAGGLTLRFARVKRYRQDKTSADANTIEDLRRLRQAAAP